MSIHALTSEYVAQTVSGSTQTSGRNRSTASANPPPDQRLKWLPSTSGARLPPAAAA